MAISFVGSAEGNAANGGNATLTLPGGLQQDDLVIVGYAVGDNDNVDNNLAIAFPTGYTEVADLWTNDAQDIDLGVFYKFMGASPDTSVIVTGFGGTDASVAAVAMVFRGVDTTTPMDVAATVAHGATGQNTMHPNPPSINHNGTAGIWTVIVGASGHLLSSSGTYTFPTGYTTNAREAGGDDSGGDCTVGMAYNSAPSDPEDPGVMTHTNADSLNYSWAACTMALRPAAAGTTLSPASLTHTRAQGSPIVSPQTKPASIVHTRAQGAPKANPQVLPAGLAHTRALGSPTITSGFTLSPASLIHTRAQGTPVLSPQVILSGLGHTRALGSPSVNPSVLITGLAHTRAQGSIVVSEALQELLPTGIAHTRAQGTPTLGVGLNAASITHTRGQGSPTLSVIFSTGSIVHNRAQGQPTLDDGFTDIINVNAYQQRFFRGEGR